MDGAPTKKDTRYDRQLRLWAQSGQAALENAHLCLVGATPLGCELVKNLVLPGLGTLTIIDGQRVGEHDVETNFFIENDCVGASRAQACGQGLHELNEDLHWVAVDKPVGDLLDRSDPDSAAVWAQFTLVILCEQSWEHAQAISLLMFERNVPVMVVDARGFYGSIRVSVSEHTILETHPDAASATDLRLDCAWPELNEYAASFNLESLDESDYEHVPFICILVKLLQEQQFAERPLSAASRAHLKKTLDNMQRVVDQENIAECSAAVWRLGRRTSVPDSVSALLRHSQASDTQLLKHKEPFWVLVAALRDYVDRQPASSSSSSTPSPLLPLAGKLPDMKADTTSYVKLQEIYTAKANKDYNEYCAVLQDLLARLQIELPDWKTLAKRMCELAAFLQVIRGTQLEDLASEMQSCGDKSDIYRALLSLRNKTPCDVSADVIEEARRFSHPLQNTAAVVGGVAAQEAIKLISHQYLPLNNTFIYDGVSSSTSTFII